MEFNQNKGKAEKSFESISFVHPGGRNNHILQRKYIEEVLSNKDDILVSGTNDVTQNEAHGVLTGVQADLHQLQEDTPWLYQWIFLMDMTFQTGLVLIKELGRQM